MVISDDSRAPDYYALLLVPHDASSADIKAAYHRALLACHPDKHGTASSRDVDIGLLKDAFNTLYTPELRKSYDAMRSRDGKAPGPRPAQVISLEEFEEEDARWTYPCRCGGAYIVTEEMLDAGQHMKASGPARSPSKQGSCIPTELWRSSQALRWSASSLSSVCLSARWTPPSTKPIGGVTHDGARQYDYTLDNTLCRGRGARSGKRRR